MPVSQSSVGVVNPVEDLLTLRENVDNDPSAALNKRMTEDLGTYQAADAEWLGGDRHEVHSIPGVRHR